MNNRAVEILLVDDDTAVRVISTRILSKAGLVVEAVADGESALDRLRRGRRFDVIVSDLVMPNIDGRELLSRVRELDGRLQRLRPLPRPGVGRDGAEHPLRRLEARRRGDGARLRGRQGPPVGRPAALRRLRARP